jgi:hypothetical protein
MLESPDREAVWREPIVAEARLIGMPKFRSRMPHNRPNGRREYSTEA